MYNCRLALYILNISYCGIWDFRALDPIGHARDGRRIPARIPRRYCIPSASHERVMVRKQLVRVNMQLSASLVVQDCHHPVSHRRR